MSPSARSQSAGVAPAAGVGVNTRWVDRKLAEAGFTRVVSTVDSGIVAVVARP